LLDSASHFGLTAGNLLWYTETKLEINKRRKWGAPDKNGVVEHILSEEEKKILAAEMIDQTCTVCGKPFKGNVISSICPSGYA